MFKRSVGLVIGMLAVSACQRANENSVTNENAVGLRPLTQKEALADFDQAIGYFKELYGPLEYKENRFGYNFENEAAKIREKVAVAQTDAEIFSQYGKLLGMLHDGHVGIRFKLANDKISTYRIPIFVTPIEDKAIVADVAEDLKTAFGIQVGDEVVKVDGKLAFDYLPDILKYPHIGRAASDKHFIMRLFNRPFYMTELTPQENTANILFKKADGTEYSAMLAWNVEKLSGYEKDVVTSNKNRANFIWEGMKEFNEAAENTFMQMAQPRPFFASTQVAEKYQWKEVTASKSFREKYGLKENETPNIFAALYRYNDKNILLVRNYIYWHQDFSNEVYMNGYKAVLDEWDDIADVVVIDQTHNGGGSYCEEFAKLFIQSEKDGFVQKLNVDRKWILDLTTIWPDSIKNTMPNIAQLFRAFGADVEAAYDTGLKLTEPIPIMGGEYKIKPLNYTMKKPLLVLVDELAGSCGDGFPMLIKNNKVAKIFGKTTMGLGGNVEDMAPLTHSQIQIRLTRGLFTSNRDDRVYSDDIMIENNGVTPDYEYDHTVEDFRNGFVKYVEAFSTKAIEQIPASAK